MAFRDRLKGLKRVKARDLVPHPENWRLHGADQRAGLRAVMDQVGFAGAILAREGDDGKFHVLDGHLRLEEANPDDELPTLVTDLSAEEGRVLLATFDGIGRMAGTDGDALDRLLADLPEASTLSEDMEILLSDLRDTMGVGETAVNPGTEAKHNENLPEKKSKWGPGEDPDSLVGYSISVPKDEVSEWKQLIAQAALARNTTPSAFIVAAARKAAEEVRATAQ